VIGSEGIVSETAETDQARSPALALAWIADRLEERGIAWRITGGLAARAHARTPTLVRPLADIDIEVPDEAVAALLPVIAPFVVYGPARFQDENWDLLLCTLDYHGQMIDLCGGSTCRIFDAAAGLWRDDPFLPGDFVLRDVLGRRCPVVHLAALIAYKRRLSRDVDRADIALLTGIDPSA
jgi:hypothetical protein